MLTRKQYELLTYIDRHLKQTGFSPSFEEMKDALQLKSKSGIHRLISALGGTRLPQPATPSPRAGARGAAPARRHAAACGHGDAGAERARSPSFSPNVIRGDFSPRIAGVRAANDAAAIQLPLYGRIAAGLPIEALRDAGSQIDVPMALLGNGEHYALEVAGNSMVEAGILDGDTVIIRKGDVARRTARSSWRWSMRPR